MSLVNDCQKCTDHDTETKALADALFHKDEKILIAFSLGATIKITLTEIVHLSKHPNPKERMRALKLQSQKDHAVQTLGKLVFTFDDLNRKGIENALETNYGLKLNFTHERCPHRGP